MSNESQLFEQIADAWPVEDEAPSPRLTELVRQALDEFPTSSEVWVMYGDYLNISDSEANPDATVENAMAAYQKALEIDPVCAEAYQELGFLHDFYRDDMPAAEQAFRNAINFGADVDAYLGLVRVLFQQGRLQEALELLSPDNCPFADEPEIVELRQDLEEGSSE